MELESVESKLYRAPLNSFIESLREFHNINGYLTARQQNALDNILGKDKTEKIVAKKSKMDRDPEQLSDLLL